VVSILIVNMLLGVWWLKDLWHNIQIWWLSIKHTLFCLVQEWIVSLLEENIEFHDHITNYIISSLKSASIFQSFIISLMGGQHAFSHRYFCPIGQGPNCKSFSYLTNSLQQVVVITYEKFFFPLNWCFFQYVAHLLNNSKPKCV